MRCLKINKPRRIVRLLENVLPLLILGGLAADLLYLYYAGGWVEPVACIRWAELVMLWAMIPGSVILAIRKVRSKSFEKVIH